MPRGNNGGSIDMFLSEASLIFILWSRGQKALGFLASHSQPASKRAPSKKFLYARKDDDETRADSWQVPHRNIVTTAFLIVQ